MAPIKDSFIIAPLLSRTAEFDSETLFSYDRSGINLYVKITVLGSANIIPHIDGFDEANKEWVQAHELTTLTGIGSFLIELYPGIDTGGGGPSNPHFSHTVPSVYRIRVVPSNANPNTYSVSGQLIP